MEGRIIVVQKCQAILPNMKNEANSGYNPVIKYGNQMAAGMKLGMKKLPRELKTSSKRPIKDLPRSNDNSRISKWNDTNGRRQPIAVSMKLLKK